MTAGSPRHSLRAPVTDENFYFVMADRFENGDTAQRPRRPRRRPARLRLRPDRARASTTAATSRACSQRIDYIQRPRHDVDLADAELQEQGGPARGRPSAGYHGYWITDFTQIDPHLGTNDDLRALVDAAHAPRHEGLLRHHHQPHGGRHRLRGGRAPALRLQGRRALPDAAGDAVRRPRLRRARTRSRALDPTTSFPYTPVLDPAEQNLKVPAWLNDVTLYHNRGDTTFVGENSLLRRLLRPRRPLHRAPARRRRDDRHLQDVDRATSASTASASTR